MELLWQKLLGLKKKVAVDGINFRGNDRSAVLRLVCFVGMLAMVRLLRRSASRNDVGGALGF